jgi:hypothetical protein
VNRCIISVSTIPWQTALIRKPLGVEPPTLPRSTGVVECDVETPERVDRLVQCSLHILGPGYVATDGESTAAEFLDHPGRVLVAVVRHIGQYNAGAFAREGQRRRTAHAASGTCYERDLAGEDAVLVRCSHSCSFVARPTLVSRRIARPRSSQLIAGISWSPDRSG